MTTTSALSIDLLTDLWAISPGVLLDEHELGAALALSVNTLRNWRSLGSGPKYRRLGGRAVRYRVSEVIEWLDRDESDVQ